MFSSAVSCGYAFTSKRQASFSVRCQWNTFTLKRASLSISFFSSSMLRNERPTSCMKPRTLNAGQSVMESVSSWAVPS